MNKMKKKRFTLLELMVVISIIVVIASLLLPALGTARNKTKQISCLNNLKNWGNAKNYYAGDYNDFLYNPKHSIGWRRTLYPYVGLKDWYLPKKSVSTCPADTTPYCTAGACFSSYGDNDFGVYIYAGEINIKLSSIKSPSRFFSMGDNQGHSLMGIADASIIYISFRHSGSINMLYFDGHAASRKFIETPPGRLSDKELWGPDHFGSWL